MRTASNNAPPVINSHVQGGMRLALLKIHRLLEFQDTFDKYLEGKATAAQVKDRAEKMLEIGLPRLR